MLVFFNENVAWLQYNGTLVEVLRKISKTETEVRFHDGKTAIVNHSDLYEPELVPFKVGDMVQNVKGFALSSGAWVCSGTTWEVKTVTYNLPNFNRAIIECFSREMAIGNTIFTINQLKKI